MVRRICQKARGKHRRKEKKLILMAVEGKNNRTETLYFAHFGREQKEYTIRFVPCNETDPVQLVAHTEQMWEKEGCDESFGDRAFCVFDTDTDPGKQQKIEEAIRNAKTCEPILSNPCFEVWFLLHFSYTSRQFRSGSELIRELQKFVPAYSKSMDVLETIQGKTGMAVANAKRLEKYHAANGNKRGIPANPCSEVYRIVELLRTDTSS